MAAIKYRVPYQVDILAHDLTSGKRIGNTFYLKCQTQLVAPPAYGAPIAGSGSTTTLLAAFAAAWEVLVLAVLSTKYKLTSYTMQAMDGYGYGTPVLAINALVAGPTFTVVTTGVPHGLTTGDVVRISGVTTPSAVNGTWSIIVVTSTQIQVPVATTGAWTGPGTVQRASGRQSFIYSDKEVLASSALGGVAGDALPIFSDVSVQRLNAGTGKNFRSRVAMAPIGEADNDFGKLNSTAIATWAAALAVFNANFNNGGTDAGSQLSSTVALSRQLAAAQPTPFTASDPFTRFVQSYLARTQLGSTVKRKPRLSSI